MLKFLRSLTDSDAAIMVGCILVFLLSLTLLSPLSY